MKRLSILFSCVLLFFFSCAPGDTNEKSAQLVTPNDSISYAIAVQLSQGMLQLMTDELGVNKEYTDDFIRGICHAFPSDESDSQYAYAQGLYIGTRAIAMLGRAQSEVYGNDTTKKINRASFLDGIVASIKGSGAMEEREAMEYYYYRMFRGASEQFMQKNATRAGVVTLASGLQYKIDKMGTGEIATPLDIVKCIYRGTFTNGSTFDSSRGEAVDLPVSKLIPGFTEALCTLPEGTKCKLYIPWELAYGARGNQTIPPYSALVFDLEIVKIIRQKY